MLPEFAPAYVFDKDSGEGYLRAVNDKPEYKTDIANLAADIARRDRLLILAIIVIVGVAVAILRDDDRSSPVPIIIHYSDPWLIFVI